MPSLRRLRGDAHDARRNVGSRPLVASGIWLALLGWITVDAAVAEEAGFELRHLLHDVLVADVEVTQPGSLVRTR